MRKIKPSNLREILGSYLVDPAITLRETVTKVNKRETIDRDEHNWHDKRHDIKKRYVSLAIARAAALCTHYTHVKDRKTEK